MMFEDQGQLAVVGRGLQVLKVAAGTRARVCMQSEVVEVVTTHWFERQFVCPGWDCPACGTYASRVMVFFVGVVQVGRRWEPRLVEVSSQSWSRLTFLSLAEGFKVSAGLLMEFARERPRSGLRVDPVEGTDEVSVVLSSRERLLDALSLLFRLPARAVEESGEQWVKRVRTSAVVQIEGAIRHAG